VAPPKRHEDEFEVDEDLVRRLLAAQFPRWTSLPLVLLEPSGTDHTIYRLGTDLVVRMPIMEYATRQAAREAEWVPFLASQVPLELPLPVAMGLPGEGYPWSWSIVRWIEGAAASPENLDLRQAAVDLGRFVRALQACDPTRGPEAGESTGWRGCP
jgi:aminoglycoside phosphotransferase (APT) family kinase protein